MATARTTTATAPTAPAVKQLDGGDALHDLLEENRGRLVVVKNDLAALWPFLRHTLRGVPSNSARGGIFAYTDGTMNANAVAKWVRHSEEASQDAAASLARAWWEYETRYRGGPPTPWKV
jgi:hypothetical protein